MGASSLAGMTARWAAAAILVLAPAVAGCAEVVREDGEEIVLDMGPIGKIMPRMRNRLAWPAAHTYCERLGKVPRLRKIEGRMATYRCVEGS